LDKDEAKKELLKKGITKDQRLGYVPGVAEALHEGVRPVGYLNWSKVKNFVPNLVLGRENNPLLDSDDSERMASGNDTPQRQDAWALYLGMPQEHGTFGISDYKPSRGHDDKYYYKINGFDMSPSYIESIV